jgi:hypothetical protein
MSEPTYEYCEPTMERQVEGVVIRVLNRLKLNEQPGRVWSSPCEACGQPLDLAAPDEYGQSTGFIPHQPGDCIRKLSERVMKLERRLAGL